MFSFKFKNNNVERNIQKNADVSLCHLIPHLKFLLLVFVLISQSDFLTTCPRGLGTSRARIGLNSHVMNRKPGSHQQ